MFNHVFPTYTWAEVPHYASDTVLMLSLKRMKRSHHFFQWTAEARFVCKLIIVTALMFGVRVVHAQRTTLQEVVSFGKIGARIRGTVEHWVARRMSCRSSPRESGAQFGTCTDTLMWFSSDPPNFIHRDGWAVSYAFKAHVKRVASVWHSGVLSHRAEYPSVEIPVQDHGSVPKHQTSECREARDGYLGCNVKTLCER